MKKNMINLILNDIKYNKGKNTNYLIEWGIIDIQNVTNEILKLEDGYSICLFAGYVDAAPIDSLADVIIETKMGYYIYLFAKMIQHKDAPMDKLTDAIIETNDLWYMRIFARDVVSASIEKIAKAIIYSGDAQYIRDIALIYKERDIPVDGFFEILKKAPIEKEVISVHSEKGKKYLRLREKLKSNR